LAPGEVNRVKSTQSLPQTYQPCGVLDLSKDKRLVLVLNLMAAVLFLLASGAFVWLALVLRGDSSFEVILTLENFLVAFLGSIVAIILVMVVHEGIHGICFWTLTGGKPRFGFRGAYAYAAVPDWYIPRPTYFIVALAPLVLITIAGVWLVPIVSQILLPFWLIGLIFNFAGSVGDIVVVIWLLGKPHSVYINDFGDGVSAYCDEMIEAD
jgi:hypothetical protein